MHIEILTEDSSSQRLLEILIPKLLGENGTAHSWRIHSYRGIGRLPSGLNKKVDPKKRVLLDQLPRILQGYGKTPGIDAVLVVLDTDSRNCKTFLGELLTLVSRCDPAPKTLFRLAIEEVEAWYFGDRDAILSAYPKAKRAVLDSYVQDSICNTWEQLADAIHPGGAAAVKKAGWPLPGQIKHDWASNIGPHLEQNRNLSPSFRKFRDGVLGLVAQ